MGGLFSYFKSLLGSREMRILILGLDGAGKTTLLYRLQVSQSILFNTRMSHTDVASLKAAQEDLNVEFQAPKLGRCNY